MTYEIKLKRRQPCFMCGVNGDEALENSKKAENLEKFRTWLNHTDLENITHAQGLLELVRDQFTSLFPCEKPMEAKQ